MCKRLLHSALAVAFSAGAIIGAASLTDVVWDGPSVGRGTSVHAGDVVWDRVEASPAGGAVQAGTEA
ncbi:hypothetical protein [Streptomyces fragilis]|uniref:Secreted protein n=1 Tax=Streptomyces fragilis TaxID=67301 RepID=A0ABV2YPI3_9ACTN|nr:hypothetical protein [Streptomyces fragilis]